MQHSTHVSVHARPDTKIAAERPQRQAVKHATARKRRQHDRLAVDDIE